MSLLEEPITAATPLSIAPREDQLWPTLTPVQLACIEKRGERRLVQPGDMLLQAGQAEFPFFAVVNGELETWPLDVIEEALGHDEHQRMHTS